MDTRGFPRTLIIPAFLGVFLLLCCHIYPLEEGAVSNVPAQQTQENQTPQATVPAPSPTSGGHPHNQTTVPMIIDTRAPPPPSRGPATVRRRPVDGECTICHVPLTSSSDGLDIVRGLAAIRVSLTWRPRECETNFLRTCLDEWKRTYRDGGRQTTCPKWYVACLSPVSLR
jgi:hypothetical protein